MSFYFQLKDIAEKGVVNPSKVPKLDDEKYDKKILTLVNKIEEIDEKQVKIMNS